MLLQIVNQADEKPCVPATWTAPIDLRLASRNWRQRCPNQVSDNWNEKRMFKLTRKMSGCQRTIEWLSDVWHKQIGRWLEHRCRNTVRSRHLVRKPANGSNDVISDNRSEWGELHPNILIRVNWWRSSNSGNANFFYLPIQYALNRSTSIWSQGDGMERLKVPSTASHSRRGLERSESAVRRQNSQHFWRSNNR
jgi:hypothetical protein